MALLINLCIAVLFVLLFLWLLNLVLARLALPDDLVKIIHVLVAIVVIAVMLSWVFQVPGFPWRPIVVAR